MAQQKVSPIDFIQNNAAQLAYQPYYCEENIWQLTQQKSLQGLEAQVVLITNQQRCVAMAQMRQCEGPKALIFWDYHVIWLGFWQQQAIVVDLDTKLPCPIALPIYLQLSFPALIDGNYRPMFRVIPAAQYAAQFSSDRRHMLREDQTYMQQPPQWPPIFDGQHHVLQQWIDIKNGEAPGACFDRESFVTWADQQAAALGNT